MAANRAVVVYGGQGNGITLNGAGGMYLTYNKLDSNNNLLTCANGSVTGQYTLTLTYANLNNITSAIQNAIQTNESDPSLQVYVA